MTDRQKFRLYLPAWAVVAKTHQWRMAQRRLVGQRRESWGGPETSAIYCRTWEAAETIARGQCRAVKPDDLRHGVHVAALGRDVSSRRLDNSMLDRVMVALKLLADPDDVHAMMDWIRPAVAERRRREWWIGHVCAPAYVARVAGDMFGRSDWRSMDDRQVEILYGRLRHRPGARERRFADASDRHLVAMGTASCDGQDRTEAEIDAQFAMQVATGEE